MKLAEKILNSKKNEVLDESAHASQGLNFALSDELNVHVNYSCGVSKRHMGGEFVEEDDIELQTKVKEIIQADADAFMKAVSIKLKTLQGQL